MINIIIILGFIILYKIIKFIYTEYKYERTEYKYEEVFVLKNEMSSNWFGGTDKPFNLIGNIPGLGGDKVYITRKDKYVFNKLIKTTFEINQSYADDSDD